MERLYISDLDGTLLTPEKTISPRTREAVNRAIAAGEGFSVATARSASTVVEILQGIQLNLPVVLMNGVFLYDIAADRYLDVQTIPLEAAQRMLVSIEGRGQKAFVYGFDGKMVVVHHKGIDPGAQEVFFHEREDKPFKRFVYTEDFGAAVHQYPVVSFVMIDSYGQLQPIYEEVAAMPELHASFYEDIYCPGAYYLEITSSGAVSYTHLPFPTEYFNRLYFMGQYITKKPRKTTTHNPVVSRNSRGCCPNSKATANAAANAKAAATIRQMVKIRRWG